MAAEAGAFVHGVDLSVNMILLALERASAAHNGFKVGAYPSCYSASKCEGRGICICTRVYNALM